jgi:hypothetical protein
MSKAIIILTDGNGIFQEGLFLRRDNLFKSLGEESSL